MTKFAQKVRTTLNMAHCFRRDLSNQEWVEVVTIIDRHAAERDKTIAEGLVDLMAQEGWEGDVAHLHPIALAFHCEDSDELWKHIGGWLTAAIEKIGAE